MTLMKMATHTQANMTAGMPIQAYAFLGAVVAFLILLVVFFLYLNKKLCFAECGGFPCIDKPGSGKKKEAKANKLGQAGQPIVKKHKHYGAADGFVNLNDVESDGISHDTISTNYTVLNQDINVEEGTRGKYTTAGRSIQGSAYAYEDADTSSDSDDEVLRRYQQTMGMQRVPSKQSVRSQRSARSAASKASKGSKKDGAGAGAEDQAKLVSTSQKDIEKEVHSEVEPSGPDEDASETEPIIPDQPAEANIAKYEADTRVDIEEGAAAGAHEYRNNAFATEDVSPEQHSSDHNVSGYGDSASMSIADVEQDEHLFDVSDLQDQEPPIISKCGNLEVTFSYSQAKGRMTITVHRAQDIPSKDRGGANNSQVRLLLLPTKKVRHKTKIKQGENPEFQETFQFKVPFEEINNMGVRMRLYGCERMRRERMIGENIIGFAALNHDVETTHMLTLEPRSNLSHGDSKLDVSSLSRSDSASSTQSMQHGGMPELLIGLAYNGTTGRLSVEVIKGSNFRNMAMNRAPDTYVKLTLMSPNGQEIARSKTSIRRGQPNPLYKETFMFQVALFQLPDVTLMTSVYNKRSMKRKEMIGWFSLGLNNSGEEELAHWNDMRESKGEQVCRWHVLLES